MFKTTTTGAVKLQQLLSIGASLAVGALLIGPAQARAVEDIPVRYDDDQYTLETEPHDDNINDSLMGLNRAIFYVNDVADGMILSPVATAYATFVPEWGRDRVSSMLNTLKQPVYMINYILQGEAKLAARSFQRFALNASFGAAGLFDVAGRAGVHDQPTDAGLTMAHYCAGTGPYLVLPLLGPTTVRDGLGTLADTMLFDPMHYLVNTNQIHKKWEYRKWGATFVDARSKALEYTKDLDDTSLDKYSFVRSMYMQHRHFKEKHMSPAPSARCGHHTAQSKKPTATTAMNEVAIMPIITPAHGQEKANAVPAHVYMPHRKE